MSNIINLVKMSYTNLNSLKKVLLLSLMIFIGLSMYEPVFLNMLIGIFVYSTLYQVMAYEDSYEINKLIGYLPVSRKEYVISRYVLGLINLLIGIVVFTLSYKVSSNLAIGSFENFNYKLTLVSGMTSAVILLSVSIPMVLKLGIVKGRYIATFIMLGIVMAPGFVIKDIVQLEGIEAILKIFTKSNLPFILIVLNVAFLVVSYIISKNIYYRKNI